MITSTTCWAAMLAGLVALSFAVGPMWILKLYVVPYWVNVVWLDAVTYLHHHGYEKKVPWYRGEVSLSVSADDATVECDVVIE